MGLPCISTESKKYRPSNNKLKIVAKGAVVDYTIKNIRGENKPLDIWQFFNDGIRKRLPKLVAQEFHQFILANIESNKYGFRLSPNWVNYKKRIGASTKPFIMYGHYKDSITVLTSEGHLAVGFKKSTLHPRAKVSMGKLAVRLEYGDLAKGVPARPLWRNSAADFFRNNRGKVNKMLKDSLV